MLSAIIATHESERALVPTLAALVPGATAGLLGEVVVADAGSRDATAEVADIAGCRFMASNEPLGARLKAAAASTRAPWLLFLRAGCVPEAGWVERRRALHRGQRPARAGARRGVPPARRRRPAAAGAWPSCSRCSASRSAAAPSRSRAC